jgi:exopolyphosphatase/guanosine-5'-triphosphate,3'-diphosphate pyrophosphatase
MRRFSVIGCAGLIDPAAESALIVDIGGGSTELSWVDAKGVRDALAAGGLDPPMHAWTSTPLGVVTLADSNPEIEGDAVWYEDLVQSIAARIGDHPPVAAMREAFAQDRAHIVGTSGTVTSLAGVHLNLKRYKRADVDGKWMRVEECRAATAKLRAMSRAERANHPCIGKDRADLVVQGGAILEAVCRLWPAQRIRVADRGLREGVLMQLIAAHRGGARG